MVIIYVTVRLIKQMKAKQISENTLGERIDDAGPLERIFPCSSSKILDHVITMKGFDYSASEISEISGVGFKTTLAIVHKLVEDNILLKTRNVGRAIMYKINSESPIAKSLEKLAFQIADERAADLRRD